jgi:hypothetical protein
MKIVGNEHGAGGKEIIIGLLVILGVFAFGVQSILNNTSDDGYKNMRAKADEFVKAVTIYKDEFTKESGIYYLADLEENKRQDDYVITDPKDKNASCDLYESYVETTNPKKFRIKCGDYLAEGEYLTKYYIYEIGEWQKEKVSGETAFFYNYEKDGNTVLGDYQEEVEFIRTYNKNEGSNVEDINSLYQDAKGKNIVIDSDMYYREKKLVKEI